MEIFILMMLNLTSVHWAHQLIGLFIVGLLILMAFSWLRQLPAVERHVRALLVTIAFLFLLGFCYGWSVVSKASADLFEMGRGRSTFDASETDQLHSACHKALRAQFEQGAWDNADLVPCQALMAAETMRQSRDAGFRAVMPLELYLAAQALLGVFHGGLAVAFFSAWAATPPVSARRKAWWQMFRRKGTPATDDAPSAPAPERAEPAQAIPSEAETAEAPAVIGDTTAEGKLAAPLPVAIASLEPAPAPSIGRRAASGSVARGPLGAASSALRRPAAGRPVLLATRRGGRRINGLK